MRKKRRSLLNRFTGVSMKLRIALRDDGQIVVSSDRVLNGRHNVVVRRTVLPDVTPQEVVDVAKNLGKTVVEIAKPAKVGTGKERSVI